ncbi:hypothetical protein DMENIID0001_144090 [Sergentomyia squamirostris]
MLRIIVDYIVGLKDHKPHKHLSLILKTSLAQVYDIRFNHQATEMIMYDEVLHKIHNLLLSINDRTIVSPRNYWQDKSTDTTILEDLLVGNYKCVNKKDRLDLKHAKLALETLAKYHAASVVLKGTEPDLYDNLTSGVLTRENKGTHDFLLRHYYTLLDLISGWSNYDYYLKKLKKLQDNLIVKCLEVYDPDSDFNVLVHGDFRSSNMMFKYDRDGSPTSVIFVDFQHTNWKSPVIDLLYFIHTSLKEELRLEKQDELIQHYHNILWETLVDRFKYNGKVPTLHELQVTILKKSMHIVTSGLLLQPLYLLDENINSDMRIIASTDETGVQFRKAMYNNPAVIDAIRNLLPYLDTKGILD